MKLSLLLTEGDHDAAFLYRMLKANGFTTFSKIIREFPAPLDSILATDVMNVSIPNMSIQSARTRFLPSNVITSGESMLLIYAMQGDSTVQKRRALIERFRSLNTTDPAQIQVTPELDLSFLYFLDADNRGTTARLAEINTELSQVFSVPVEQLLPSNAAVVSVENIKIGAFIFSNQGSEYGKLEDILLPMMEQGNEDVFGPAREYLSIHKETTLYKDHLQYNESQTEVVKVFGDKYYYEKALIGTIGQLHKAGKSNTVCISDSHYLNEDKLKGNAICQSIVAFISRVISPPAAAEGIGTTEAGPA
jgi:hypothetical protein